MYSGQRRSTRVASRPDHYLASDPLMPPKPTTQKGNRRVTIDPALTASSKATNKNKTKVPEASKTSRRSVSRGSDMEEDQDDEGDALNGSQDANSSAEVRRLLNEKLSKRNKKQSAKFMELEVTVKELFREARESSEERKRVCKAMLEDVLLGFEGMHETGVEPDTMQTVHLLGVRSKLAIKAATTHQVMMGPIKEEAEAAVKEVEENLGDHEQLRQRSRKRLMKHAAKEFKRGLDAQKFATDATVYIRHYRKLIML